MHLLNSDLLALELLYLVANKVSCMWISKQGLIALCPLRGNICNDDNVYTAQLKARLGFEELLYIVEWESVVLATIILSAQKPWSFGAPCKYKINQSCQCWGFFHSWDPCLRKDNGEFLEYHKYSVIIDLKEWPHIVMVKCLWWRKSRSSYRVHRMYVKVKLDG